MENEVVLFRDGEVELEVQISPDQETVWLTQDQMSDLFETARSSIAYHIGNIVIADFVVFVIREYVVNLGKVFNMDPLFLFSIKPFYC